MTVIFQCGNVEIQEIDNIVVLPRAGDIVRFQNPQSIYTAYRVVNILHVFISAKPGDVNEVQDITVYIEEIT